MHPFVQVRCLQRSPGPVQAIRVYPTRCFSLIETRPPFVTLHSLFSLLDGSIKCWESDSGKATATLVYHEGWVTNLLYWPEGRILYSSSVDGRIVQWSPNGTISGVTDLGVAVYALAWCESRQVLVAGQNGQLSLLSLTGTQNGSGHPLLSKKGILLEGHTDMVRCIASCGNKIYSGGFDRQLCIYEIPSSPSSPRIKPLLIKTDAHAAGITCLWVSTDADGSNWIFTGSFDRQVKIWTNDGKVLNTLLFMDAVSGICYVPETGILWVAAGSISPYHFEPKSGENVSEFLDLKTTTDSVTSVWNSSLQFLKYIPETSEVIGILSTREAVVWRYSPNSCLSLQKVTDNIETLTYTQKIPILIFTGTSNGHMKKWERLQLNRFMYNQEDLFYLDELKRHLNRDDGEWNLPFFLHGSEGQHQELTDKQKIEVKKMLLKPEYREFVKSVYVESMDILVASARDGKIFVWGFDKKAAEVLKKMHKSSHNTNNSKDMKTEDLVTYNRVAGYIVQHILNGHSGPVPGIALVEGATPVPCLLSAGWDLTVCVWNLTTGSLILSLKDCVPLTGGDDKQETETLITDIAYSPSSNTFVISSSNHNLYLMTFSTRAKDIKLLRTLMGHGGEVTQVCWNPSINRWISASEDRMIFVWAEDGSEYENSVVTHGPVSVLCIDKTYGHILAGVQDNIWVYNDQLDVIQVSKGHTDLVRTLLHIPERRQYLSAAWDHTLRIWNSSHPKIHGKEPSPSRT